MGLRFCALTGGAQTRLPFVDHDVRRARRLGAPPLQRKPASLGFALGAACGGLKALHLSAKFPARKIRLRVLIPSGTLGPDAVQNCGLCHFTAVPGSDQPWQGMRDRVCAGWGRSHEPGTGESGTRPYGVFRTLFNSRGTGAVSWLWRSSYCV